MTSSAAGPERDHFPLRYNFQVLSFVALVYLLEGWNSTADGLVQAPHLITRRGRDVMVVIVHKDGVW